MEEKELKTIKSYSLRLANIRWLEGRAARLTLKNGEYTSASKLLDDIVSEARKEEERIHRFVKKIMEKVPA